jgi:hypothetical protein
LYPEWAELTLGTKSTTGVAAMAHGGIGTPLHVLSMFMWNTQEDLSSCSFHVHVEHPRRSFKILNSSMLHALCNRESYALTATFFIQSQAAASTKTMTMHTASNVNLLYASDVVVRFPDGKNHVTNQIDTAR